MKTSGSMAFRLSANEAEVKALEFCDLCMTVWMCTQSRMVKSASGSGVHISRKLSADFSLTIRMMAPNILRCLRRCTSFFAHGPSVRQDLSDGK